MENNGEEFFNFEELINAEELRKVFLKYTIKAYNMIPYINKPNILDVGCGLGNQTLELAKITDGRFTGIDIDQSSLNKFNLKIEKLGLKQRIDTQNISIYDFKSPLEFFDIIWTEGVIHLLKLDMVLRNCNDLLKPNGYLIQHETTRWMNKNSKYYSKFGFNLLDFYLLPKKSWWNEYYLPLKNKIENLKKEYTDANSLHAFRKFDNEIKMVEKNPNKFNTGFYIFQKIS